VFNPWGISGAYRKLPNGNYVFCGGTVTGTGTQLVSSFYYNAQAGAAAILSTDFTGGGTFRGQGRRPCRSARGTYPQAFVILRSGRLGTVTLLRGRGRRGKRSATRHRKPGNTSSFTSRPRSRLVKAILPLESWGSISPLWSSSSFFRPGSA
jgi:hypothetical protein